MDNLNMNTVTNLNDADYSTIESRVKGFRLDHPSGQILTEIVKHDDKTGEIIFKAHAVVDGVIKGIGHALEIKGSSNINKISNVECAETIAVGRCLAMLGYIGKGQIASYEEIENAKFQREELKKKERKLEADIASLSIRFKKAIEIEDEELILECQKDMRGNEPLHQGVNEALSASDKQYLTDRLKKLWDEREIRQEKREARNRVYAKEFAEKQMKKKKNLNG